MKVSFYFSETETVSRFVGWKFHALKCAPNSGCGAGHGLQANNQMRLQLPVYSFVLYVYVQLTTWVPVM